MKNMKGFVVELCTMVELGGLAGLACIALKRNKDAYDAEIKSVYADAALELAKLDIKLKDGRIQLLEKQVEELKGENSVEDKES